MSEPRIVLDEKVIRKIIHYAIDIVDDTFYFGCWLPIENSETIEEGLAYITNKYEVFAVTEDTLKARGLRWQREPSVMPTRLGVSGVKGIIEGATCASCASCAPTSYIKEELKKYIDLSNPYEYTLIALWTIGTYLLPVWKSYPYLSISGLKRTGKTKLLTFLKLTAFNGVLSVSVTQSSLFRVINDMRCTFLIDEAAKLSSPERYYDIKEILDAGYKKGGFVIRTEEIKKRRIPTRFEVFSPKAIVTYKGLEEVLNDRSINIVMLRSTNKDILNIEIDEEDSKWERIRNCLYAFALKNWKKIKNLYDNYPRISFLEGRAWELWKPLISILHAIHGEEQVKDFCENYVKIKIEEAVEMDTTSPESLLLTALYINVTKDDFYTVSEITNWLRNVVKAEQGEADGYEMPKWLTNEWVGRTLKNQFGIPRTRRQGKRKYYLSKNIVKTLCKKYLIYTDVEAPEALEAPEAPETPKKTNNQEENLWQSIEGKDSSEVR
jgi:hypothetical protein